MEGLQFADVLKIAAGSGVVAAVVTALINFFKDRWQSREQRRFDAELQAIHLISKLDALAAQCARNYWEFYSGWAEHLHLNESGGAPGCVKPEFSIDPDGLSKIDRALACRIAWIENDIRLGSDGIRARWEVYLDSEDAVEADADLVGYFGYEALSISKALRLQYKLTHQGAQWGMPRIEAQLKKCSEDAMKFFQEHG
ncbi:hypothetical protein [Pseudomonas syringae]|uniref:hypothetical protein n=1 Tax=Pseudomonas syringae TaxID=317 RepID=UPI000E322B3C|nr:hypothetical protein [Pseudomonas syringae]